MGGYLPQAEKNIPITLHVTIKSMALAMIAWVQ